MWQQIEKIIFNQQKKFKQMKSTNTLTDSPKLFLTDYASYNNGKQFEFGHWVDLTDFSDADEFTDYIKNHFEEADEKSPLNFGEKREEIMFTDYENFPSKLYSESMCKNELENLFSWINLDDNKKAAFYYLFEIQGYDFDDAIKDCEDIFLTEYDSNGNDKYYLFEEYFPDAAKADEKCDFIEINYDRFIDEYFYEFEYEGKTYLASN